VRKWIARRLRRAADRLDKPQPQPQPQPTRRLWAGDAVSLSGARVETICGTPHYGHSVWPDLHAQIQWRDMPQWGLYL